MSECSMGKHKLENNRCSPWKLSAHKNISCPQRQARTPHSENRETLRMCENTTPAYQAASKKINKVLWPVTP